jgi:membrane-bound lytic murein transglycosylase D
MKFTNHLLAAIAVSSLMGAMACQSAHPAAQLPPKQANAPALTAKASPTSISSDKSRQSDASAPSSKPDPVDGLVANVEKEFQSGQDNFKAGNVEEARQHFNFALDLLVAQSSGIPSDPRLDHEFSRVLAGLNDFEQEQALKQTDAQAQAENAPAEKTEPAPIDEANAAAAPVDANVKAKAAAEVKGTHSDLPLMMTDSVAGYINYFSGRGHGVLERALARSGRYDEMIRSTLKQEGVPQDLIFLAQAESGFHPTALSRVGARGMWQFMASRGRGYGLERNLWVDDRQDPEKSTRAAAHHLKDLYREFGDWYLAMAAYNSGPGTVQQAVKRTGYADFWELYKRDVLPKETRNYVPIILAMTIMTKNPAQYGLEDVVREKPVPYDTVKLDAPVDLRLAAECAGTTPDVLQDLNPSLLRWTTPKTDEPFELRLPAGSADNYRSAIAAIPPEMRVWWRYHKVVPGETVASLARSYRTTPEAILKTNDLDEDASLFADTFLVIPITPGRHSVSEDTLSYTKRITRYKVRRGDTVQSVAENFGVPETMVRRWNGLRGNSVLGHRILYVHLPVAPNAHEAEETANSSHSSLSHSSLSRTSGNRPGARSSKTVQAASKAPIVHHKVAPGETLSSIASVHHTTVQALKRDNNIATLRPGMILLIRQ